MAQFLVATMGIGLSVWCFAEDSPIAGNPRESGTGPGARTDALGDPLPSGARLRLGSSRFQPPSGTCDMALSPDESVIVTVGNGLIGWDTATGKQIWSVSAQDSGFVHSGAGYGIHPIAFAADSSRFFTKGNNRDLWIWDTRTGKRTSLPIKRARAPAETFPPVWQSIDVTPDAKRFALGGSAGVIVCDEEGGVQFEIANKTDDPEEFNDDDRLTFSGATSLARFSPDGKMLAVVTDDRPAELRLYATESGQETQKIGLAARLVRLAFSPDGMQIAATERDNAVRLYDVQSGKRLWEHVVALDNKHENYTSAIAFSPDAKTIVVGATDHRLHLLDSKTGKEVGTLVGHRSYPWALAFAANSKLLYSSGWDAAVRRWDVPTRKQLDLPQGVRGSGIVGASPDARTVAYADELGAVHLVDASTARELRKFDPPDVGFSQLLFSPNGRYLAGGGSTADQVHVGVWESKTGDLLRRWDWPKGRDPHSGVEALSFTPDGNRLAAADFRQSAAYVWDLTSGNQISELDHWEISGLSFAPDGVTLATAGFDKTIKIWNAQTGELGREVKVRGNVQGQNPGMYAVAYSPRGDEFATAGMDNVVRIWDADRLVQRTRFLAGGRSISGAISYSPDGLWLAIGADDGCVELWDPQSGMKVSEVGRHQSHVYTVSFSGDGRTLLSGGNDNFGYLWDLAPRDLRPTTDLPGLWNALIGDDAPLAFRAMWNLTARPDEAVGLLAEKLRPLKFVIDPDHFTEGSSPEETEQRKRMLKLKAERDPTTQLVTPVRRAIALLAQLRTPEAIRLLEELRKQDPEGELGKAASAALERVKLFEQR